MPAPYGNHFPATSSVEVSGAFARRADTRDWAVRLHAARVARSLLGDIGDRFSLLRFAVLFSGLCCTKRLFRCAKQTPSVRRAASPPPRARCCATGRHSHSTAAERRGALSCVRNGAPRRASRRTSMRSRQRAPLVRRRHRVAYCVCGGPVGPSFRCFSPRTTPWHASCNTHSSHEPLVGP